MLSLFLVSPSFIHAQAPTADSDWAQVVKALDAAKAAYDKDCPNGVCPPDTEMTVARNERKAAYARARDLLRNYSLRWGGASNSPTFLRLSYRLGLASDGMEDYVQAFKYYAQCVQANPPALVTFKQNRADQPLLTLCSAGVERECKMLVPGCFVAHPPPVAQPVSNPVEPAPFLRGTTSDIKPLDPADVPAQLTNRQAQQLQELIKQHSGIQ
ncbi:hypothetical protein [Granulicella rosea]|nr:hypothetical protein [Granulicella rosea]